MAREKPLGALNRQPQRAQEYCVERPASGYQACHQAQYLDYLKRGCSTAAPPNPLKLTVCSSTVITSEFTTDFHQNAVKWRYSIRRRPRDSLLQQLPALTSSHTRAQLCSCCLNNSTGYARLLQERSAFRVSGRCFGDRRGFPCRVAARDDQREFLRLSGRIKT